MKNAIIILLVAVVGGMGLALYNNSQDFGSLRVLENSYSSGSTNASSSVGVTATSTITADPNRQYLAICNDGAGIVSIHESATATGVTIQTGYPIASSTAYEHCYTADSTHPYLGQIYWIANTTTTVRYISK